MLRRAIITFLFFQEGFGYTGQTHFFEQEKDAETKWACVRDRKKWDIAISSLTGNPLQHTGNWVSWPNSCAGVHDWIYFVHFLCVRCSQWSCCRPLFVPSLSLHVLVFKRYCFLCIYIYKLYMYRSTFIILALNEDTLDRSVVRFLFVLRGQISSIIPTIAICAIPVLTNTFGCSLTCKKIQNLHIKKIKTRDKPTCIWSLQNSTNLYKFKIHYNLKNYTVQTQITLTVADN